MPENDDIKNNLDNDENSAPQEEISPKAFEPERADFQQEETRQDNSPVTVQPVQFASFEDLEQVQGPQNQNLNILLDVKLQLTVELYANGKLIAHGEVVVIEDNFGLRITHITDPARRLHSLGSQSNSAESQQ